jgi:hypothetical protein
MTNGFQVDPILLGHNAFFGVNHLSQSLGMEKMRAFRTAEDILRVIRMAKEEGAGGMMLSTHAMTESLAKAAAADPQLKGFGYYILMPYMQKYVTQMNEKGPLNLLKDVAGASGVMGSLGLLWDAAKLVAGRNVNTVIKMLIDVELAPLKQLNIKAIFLHNVLTDLGLGLGARPIFEFFDFYCRDQYKVEPAFCTLNYARLRRFLKEMGMERPLMMAPFNKIGFQMNPGREENERALAEGGSCVIAMSCLAGGALRPREAFAYLGGLKGIDSVVVGTSSPAHIRETYSVIRECLHPGGAQLAR